MSLNSHGQVFYLHVIPSRLEFNTSTAERPPHCREGTVLQILTIYIVVWGNLIPGYLLICAIFLLICIEQGAVRASSEKMLPNDRPGEENYELGLLSLI